MKSTSVESICKITENLMIEVITLCYCLFYVVIDRFIMNIYGKIP